MTDRAHFAEMSRRLRAIRHARRLTQAQLSVRADLGVYIITMIEGYGAVYLRAERMTALATAMGVTVDDVQAEDWRARCGVPE